MCAFVYLLLRNDLIRAPKLRDLRSARQGFTQAHTLILLRRALLSSFLFIKTLFSELASDTQMRVLDEHLIRIAAV